MDSLAKLSNRGSTLRDHLKAVLKTKKITYGALAKKIGVSEVTVKRWMTSQDMRLEDLIRLCESLDINPTNLTDADLSAIPVGSEFTIEQENFLARNPIDALVFTKVLMGSDFFEAQNACQITLKRMLKSCRQLEQLSLLSLGPENKISITTQGPFRWRKNGPLEGTYFLKFRDAIWAHLQRHTSTIDTPNDDDITLFRPFEFYLDSKCAAEMSQELSKILLKYRNISHKNVNKWKHKKVVSGVLAMSDFDAWSKVFLDHSAVMQSDLDV